MSDIVDARGLSCPQPVLLALSKMKEKTSGEIEVVVDNEVSRENVSRAARSQGWEVREGGREGDDTHLILTH
ncbi:sulfurtransferase TusA family protein [Desulforhabdus sp. TSK]|uniref:sulfurtransferase TusA family protein n=1 Tax=Desulforhabdus sp. TSK TaxID=2925014 RepID=UPI001FC874F1|nr:sulfurtransferase TusA family protein [Desulforhabdus sp. TSK]GKT10942.1 preprotein translocase subunit TatB [Desulforhabdus sp. TSK]